MTTDCPAESSAGAQETWRDAWLNLHNRAKSCSGKCIPTQSTYFFFFLIEALLSFNWINSQREFFFSNLDNVTFNFA